MASGGETYSGSAPRRIEDWRGVRVLVVGLARSGLAAARLLLRHGAQVIGYDRRSIAALPGVQDLAGKGVELFLGDESAVSVAQADVLVVSPGVPPTSPPVAEADRRGMPAVSEVEIAFQASKAPWIAITGTNGKSTTTALAGSLLQRAGRNAWVAGNIGHALSDGIEEVGEDGVVVAEVSSFQLERTVTFRPHVSVLLNLASDHLDRYESHDDYVEAKARIFQEQGEGDFAILNADDDNVARLADRGRARVFTFSRRGRVVSGSYAENGEVWTTLGGETHRLLPLDEIRLPGPHNLENALAASSIALALGVLDNETGREVVIAGLKEFAGLEHRLEFCGELEGRRYFNDSKATNVASLRQALFSLPQPLTLIAGGRDKHGDFAGLARIVEERVSHLVLIGEAADILANAWRRVSQERAQDMEDAVRRASAATPSGGVIALSPGCASYDMYRDFEDRGRQFKLAVKRLIREREAGGRS